MTRTCAQSCTGHEDGGKAFVIWTIVYTGSRSSCVVGILLIEREPEEDCRLCRQQMQLRYMVMRQQVYFLKRL